MAAATATLASLNKINISQLIQIAHTISNKNKSNTQQKGHSTAKTPEVKAREVDVIDMDIDSPSPFSSPLDFSSDNNHASNSKGNSWDQLVKGTAKRNTIVSKKQTVKFNIDEQPTSAADMVVKDKVRLKNTKYFY